MKTIPEDVRQQVEKLVTRFNEKHLHKVDVRYIPRFKGRYLYLDRCDYGKTGPICRLEYTGNFDDWEFAIFRWSSERYDPEEWMFPGSDSVDGTVEGAMWAGLQAYSP